MTCGSYLNSNPKLNFAYFFRHFTQVINGQTLA
jgi:hypothetical protein